MRKPALMLPMGGEDYQNGSRMSFLRSCRKILDGLDWCIGIEAKGGSLRGWAYDCFREIASLDGRITWHPPQSATKKLHQGVDENLAKIAEEANYLRQHGLEAVTIHCAPAVSIDLPEDAGLERYNSPISAEEMLAHITAQVEPLKQLNKLTGGILHIENVDIIQFRDGGYRVPTYLALQTGCYLDLAWLRRQTDVKTTFDSEHFLCSQNLLRQKRTKGF